MTTPTSSTPVTIADFQEMKRLFLPTFHYYSHLETAVHTGYLKISANSSQVSMFKKLIKLGVLTEVEHKKRSEYLELIPNQLTLFVFALLQQAKEQEKALKQQIEQEKTKSLIYRKKARQGIAF